MLTYSLFVTSLSHAGMTQNWIWQLWPKIITFIPLWILINHTNIIYLSSKSMQFCKIRRLWHKNWACHAHLKFKIQKGVAGLFYEYLEMGKSIFVFNCLCPMYKNIFLICYGFFYVAQMDKIFWVKIFHKQILLSFLWSWKYSKKLGVFFYKKKIQICTSVLSVRFLF